MFKTARKPSHSTSFFEIHTFHGAYWLCARTLSRQAEAVAAAEQMVQEKIGQGVRLVRCIDLPEYDYVARTVLSRTVTDPSATDPAIPLVVPGQEMLCRIPADFRGDRQRETIIGTLARWLDENRVTPIELLHSPVHAVRLANTGVILQGTLQKVAIAQVRNTDIPVQKRYKELFALWDAVVAELQSEARSNPPPVLGPGGWGALCGALADRWSGQDLRIQQFRALAAWLLPAKTWTEKVDLLGRLVADDLPERDLMPIDAVFAEILAISNVMGEPPGQGEKLDHLVALIGLNTGLPDAAPPAAEAAGLGALARMVGAGLGPRTRYAIRQRLLAELNSTAPLRKGNTLLKQAEALHTLREHLAGSPLLGEDAELQDALELRAMRSISPESVHDTIANLRHLSERLSRLAKLAGLMPHASSRARIMEFIKGIFSVEDLIREGGGGRGDRSAAVPLLVDIHRQIAGVEADSDSKDPILGQLDAALLDLLRNDVLNAPNRSYFDRVLSLIKICGTAPLPEGRARALASETIGRAVNSQEFLKPFLKRFKTEAERKQALHSLRDLLVAAGLGRSNGGTTAEAAPSR